VRIKERAEAGEKDGSNGQEIEDVDDVLFIRL
jgi:hypothetical protein